MVWVQVEEENYSAKYDRTNEIMQNNSPLPPGPKPFPIIGNMLQFQRDQIEYMQRMRRTYGNMVTIHVGKTPVVMVFRPEHIRYILTEHPRNFTSLQSTGDMTETVGQEIGRASCRERV